MAGTNATDQGKSPAPATTRKNEMAFLPVLAVIGAFGGMLAAFGTADAPVATSASAVREAPALTATQPAPPQQLAQAAPAPSAPAAPKAPPAKSASDLFSAEQKKAIGEIVREYLIANPEVFAEVQAAFEAKQEAQRAETIKKALAENASQIFRSPTAPIAGNAKGDITVVEFFDYNCGYCKRALGDIARLLDTDKKVKFVFKELPIFGKDSEGAARVAIAAKRQNKYWEVHRGLLESPGKADEIRALDVAMRAGLNMEQLRKDMASSEVKKEITDVRALAERMGIQGTPHFFVGEKFIPGAPEDLYDVLVKYVAEIRKAGGCKVC
jgi:protein-disulfide isomerase